MRVILNGAATEVQASTVEGALDELGYGGQAVATALNEAFVPKGARATTDLSDGDRLEVVTPRQGG